MSRRKIKGPALPQREFSLAAIPTDELPEFLRTLQRADRRVGLSPAERLRWVLAFVDRDLDQLHPEERVALGWDFRAIALPFMPDVEIPGVKPGLQWSRRHNYDATTPISEDKLRGYQKQLRDSLAGLFASEPRPWRLPAVPSFTVVHEGGGGYYLEFGADEEAGIVGAVALLLTRAGHLIRSCAQCGRRFVGLDNRQRYCSAACSQRMRNSRRQPSPRKREPRGITASRSSSNRPDQRRAKR